jgi:hypothetical protein
MQSLRLVPSGHRIKIIAHPCAQKHSERIIAYLTDQIFQFVHVKQQVNNYKKKGKPIPVRSHEGP